MKIESKHAEPGKEDKAVERAQKHTLLAFRKNPRRVAKEQKKEIGSTCTVRKEPRPSSRHLRAQLFNSHRRIFFNFSIGNEEGRELVDSRSIPLFFFRHF